jgi:hypothetical protein
VLAAYLVYLGVLLAHRRGVSRQRRGGQIGNWTALLGHVLGSALAGYLVFVVLVGVFYFVLGDQPSSFILRAAVEQAIFGFGIVVPLLLLLAWTEERFRRRP